MVCGSLDSPSSDEVRQSNNEGANRHQDTTHSNYFWPMELGTKVTDKGYDQQVTWEDGDRRVIICHKLKPFS